MPVTPDGCLFAGRWQILNIFFKLCTVWGFFCVQELPRKASFQSWIMVYRQYTCTESYSLSWFSSIFTSSSAVGKVRLWHWDVVPFAALPPAGVYNWNEKCVWRQDAFQTRANLPINGRSVDSSCAASRHHKYNVCNQAVWESVTPFSLIITQVSCEY